MASATLTPNDFDKLNRNLFAAPRSSQPHKLYERAAFVERMAEQVEKDWSSVPADVQESLKAVVYSAYSPEVLPLGKRLKTHVWRTRRAWFTLQNQNVDALLAFEAAALRLQRAVLDAVESEDATFSAMLEDLLSSVHDNPDASTTLNRDSAREHFSRLLREAASDV